MRAAREEEEHVEHALDSTSLGRAATELGASCKTEKKVGRCLRLMGELLLEVDGGARAGFGASRKDLSGRAWGAFGGA